VSVASVEVALGGEDDGAARMAYDGLLSRVPVKIPGDALALKALEKFELAPFAVNRLLPQ
jgi:hypothetical protein